MPRSMPRPQQLGYRPNVAARALRTDKSRPIAFISDYVATTRFASGLIRGALAAADEAKHVMLVLETGGEPAREIQAIEAALDRQVDGIIFAAMRAREVFVPDIASTVPVVMLNGTSARFPISVLPDEYEGGRTAVRLLAEAGLTRWHRPLGAQCRGGGGLFRSQTVSLRLAGIRDEMATRGLSFVAELSCWDWEPNHGYDLVSKLLERQRPRALLCLNDRLAFGAYQAIGDAGLKHSATISAWCRSTMTKWPPICDPGLTTIALPHEAMGHRAVELLLQPGERKSALVPMPTLVRGSLK